MIKFSYSKNKLKLKVQILASLRSHNLTLFIKTCLYTFCILLLICQYSNGEMATDGTLGPAINLTGPDFIIDSELGKIKGNNLFHSFKTFNIQNGESAEFTGPENISNIISRVTGQNSSWIDGRLSSEIAGANFYLINPSGIMFGPNATLNIDGSFHVSTADYLKLGATGRFDATMPEQSVFVTAPPSAFGFTSANPEKIAIGSASADPGKNKNTLLEVPEGKTISIIGGKIEITNSSLFAKSGRINLASAGSSGEVVLADDGIKMNGFESKNEILILRNTNPHEYNETTLADIEAGGMIEGKTGGDIYICSGQFIMNGKYYESQGKKITIPAIISSSNYGTEKGGKIDIQSSGTIQLKNAVIHNRTKNDGNGEDINIIADNITLSNANIVNDTLGLGKGGDINIKADSMTSDKESPQMNRLATVTYGKKNSGDIILSIDQLTLNSKDNISANTTSNGDSGSIHIKAGKAVNISGNIYTNTYAKGKSGNIHINSPLLHLDGGTLLARTSSDGNAGTIELNVNTLKMSNEAQISTSSGSLDPEENNIEAEGKGGEINVTANSIEMDGINDSEDASTGIFSKTYTRGKGGNIAVTTEIINMKNGSKLSARSEKEGDAGTIDITANKILTVDNSIIETYAENAGGGRVDLQGSSIQLLNQSKILSKVISGENNAGHIKLTADSIAALNGVEINASTDDGKGGNIIMDTDVYFKTDDFVLDNFSNIQGNEGKIEINTPDIDISGALTALPSEYLDISQYIKSPCNTLSGERVSQFTIQARDGVPMPFNDFQASPVIRVRAGTTFIEQKDKQIIEHEDTSLIKQKNSSMFETYPAKAFKKAAELYEKGDYAGAILIYKTIYSDALNLNRSIKKTDSRNKTIFPIISEAALSLSRSYQKLGFHQKAKECLLNILPMVIESNHHSMNALIFSSLGDIFLISGEISNSQHYFMKSIEQADLSQNLLIQASIMNNIGNLFAVGGYTSESMDIYTTCLELLQKPSSQKGSVKKNKNVETQFINNHLKTDLIAKVYLNILRLQQFINQQSNRNSRHVEWASILIENPQALLKALRIESSFYESSFNQEKFLKKMIIASQLIHKQFDGNSKALNLTALAWLALKITETTTKQNPNNSLTTLDMQSATNMQFSETQEFVDCQHPFNAFQSIAHKALAKVFTIAQKTKNSHAGAYACGYTGMLHEQIGAVEEALSWTQKAILYTQNQYAPEILYQWHWQMGRLYKITGQPAKAIASILKALKILTPIQNEFFQGYHKKEGIFKENVKAVYLNLAELYLELAQNTRNQKAKQTLLLQARDVVEYLKTAEIQNFFQDECIAETKKMSRLNKNTPGTAILYPIMFKHELKIIVNFDNKIKLFTSDVKATTIHKMVTEFYNRLQQPNNNRFRFYARKLHKWLIKPITKDLKEYQIHTLVVSPDGILGLIPFGALFDGKNYLIEKYAVVVVPGITLTDQKKRSANMNALACGLSWASTEFPALPHVSDELKIVNAIIGGSILENANFTTDNFIKALSQTQFNILHIATHGNFGLTPKQTFLLTNNGKFTMDQLRQLVLHLKFRNQPVELMTLSACQTATGDERSALGLAGTALNTGVESALATLWTVDDKAAFILVKKFYETLNEFRIETASKTKKIDSELTKSKAIQTAQRQMLDMVSFRHPFYWAPFTLIGNWL